MTWLVFGSVFLVYLSRLGPALAPWRDSGEMTLASWTLGVAHPTSYPLYVLVGRALAVVPLANFAYRLNLFSSVCGAAAAALVFSAKRPRQGLFPALAASAWLAFNGSFWAVTQVSEMYAAWVLGALVLALAARAASEDGGERLWPGFCFLSGLLLANRLDLLLWAPGLLWTALAARPAAEGEDSLWAGLVFVAFPVAAVVTGSNAPFAVLVVLTLLWRTRGPGMGRRVGLATAAGLAGLSAYLFLPVRSATGPLLDWNHPAAWENFRESLLRTRYGGTLDLISLSYATGANFDANLRLWGAHLWDAFGPAGLLAALAGVAAGFRADRRRWLGRAACWWWSGPVFLFLANLPPNPHAAAIVDPHYLLSDAALLLWAGEGAGALAASAPAWGPVLAAAALVWPLWRGVPSRLDRRERYYSYDFAKNAFRAAPPGSVLVAKKDVPLYALWHYQSVQGWRPDVRVVAQGLGGTPWYQADWRRRDPSLPLSPLTVPEGWAALALGGRAVMTTQDAELPPPVAGGARARGLLLSVSPAAPSDEGGQWDLVVRRGVYRHDDPPDFFTADIIEEYAAASYRRGLDLQKAGKADAAKVRFDDAWRMDWDFPEAPLFEGYLAAVAGRWTDAAAVGALADALFDRKLKAADEYRALPELKAAVRRQAAESATQTGLALEKAGRRDEAAAEYRRALGLFPLAQTYYDLAVLMWGRDWAAVESALGEALRLEPGHAEARAAAAKLAALRRR